MTNTMANEKMDPQWQAPHSGALKVWCVADEKPTPVYRLLLLLLSMCLFMSLSSLSHAANLSIVASSTPGKFDVRYSSNSRYYVFFIEISPDSSGVVVQTDSGTPKSGSTTVTKANGTYGYRLRLCDRLTSGSAGNCTHTAVRNVTVNTASTGGAVRLDYHYDALGRLIQTKENNTIGASYCYDDAGNRLLVSQGGTHSDPCANYSPPRLAAPTTLPLSTHTGGGYTIRWGVVEGATRYILRISNGTTHYIHNIYQTTFYTNNSSEAPLWIQACNTTSCSLYTYF